MPTGETPPKALVKISPKSDDTYLSVQGRDILFAQKFYKRVIPWLLFVNPLFREMFMQYLENQKYFGLSPEQIIFTEHTGSVPSSRYRRTGRPHIALLSDLDGRSYDIEYDQISFGTSGHGFFAYGFRHNPVYDVTGKEIRGQTPYQWLKERGIRQLFQANIDNLAATISTPEYPTLLGYYAHLEKTSGIKMLVELVNPLIVKEGNDGTELWDDGGVAVNVDGRATVIDPSAFEAEVSGWFKSLVQNPDQPFPFNTANATYGIESIPSDIVLRPMLTGRKGKGTLYETSFWTLSMTGRVPTAFVIVPHEFPDSLGSQVPHRNIPGEFQALRSGSLTPAATATTRFNPVKKLHHAEFAQNLFTVSVEPRQLHSATPSEPLHSKVSLQNSARILIVDDQPDFLNPVVNSLADLGWNRGNIDTAVSPTEAREKLRTTRYHFVILDAVLLPGEGINHEDNGAAIATDCKKDRTSTNYNTPMLLWSGYDSKHAFHGLSHTDSSNLGKRGVLIEDKAALGGNLLSDYILRSWRMELPNMHPTCRRDNT